MKQKKTNNKTIETLTHDEAKRKNIPTAEFQSVLQKEAQDPLKIKYPRSVNGLDEEKAISIDIFFARLTNPNPAASPSKSSII